MPTATARRCAALAAVLGLVGVAGCNTSALTKRELEVIFTASATQAQHLAAAQACAHAAPDTALEPVDTTSSFASSRQNDVRFRIDNASDKEEAELVSCLERQPGVQGVNIPDLTN